MHRDDDSLFEKRVGRVVRHLAVFLSALFDNGLKRRLHRGAVEERSHERFLHAESALLPFQARDSAQRSLIVFGHTAFQGRYHATSFERDG